MPFFSGVVFIIPTLIFIGMLRQVPSPTADDVANRSARIPMPASERRKFFAKYAVGLVCVITIYLFVTLLRSIRADFAPELWRDLGYRQTPELFTQSELLVSFGVVLINGLAIFILNHYRAFRFSLTTCLAGFIILLLAVFGLNSWFRDFAFMVLVGLGVYLPYVAIHTTVFERLIAITKERGNIGFLMYVADSVGYTGYILLMLFRYATPPGESILILFLKICVGVGIAGILITLYCSWYFRMKLKTNGVRFAQIVPGQSSHL